MRRTILVYGVVSAALALALKFVEYRFLVVEHSLELYGGLVARLGVTPRELEILGLIAEGLSTREISERLYVSENTVKTHSSRLFAKLGARRRTQAVQLAKEAGLVP